MTLRGTLVKAKSASLLVLACLIIVPLVLAMPVVAFTGSMNATIAYGQSGQTMPKYRLWNGSGWGEEADASSFEVADRWVVLKVSPTRDEKILGVLNGTGHLYVQVWNGSSWQSPLLVTTAIGTTNDNYRGFDIAYEQVSGDAILVYQNNTNDPFYRIWNGSGWSSANNIDLPTNGIPVWIRMEAKPEADEIILMTLDAANYVTAAVWNGSGWGNGIYLESGTESVTQEGIAIAYERLTGRAMVMWSEGAADEPPQYRLWTGTAWTSEANVPSTGDEVVWIKLASDPTSNKILMAAACLNSDLAVNVWDGSSWLSELSRIVEGGLETTGPTEISNFDAAFEKSGDQAMVAWGTADSHSVNYSLWYSSNNSWSGAITGPNVGNDIKLLQLASDPYTDGIFMGTVIDNSTLQATLWNGSGWGTVDALETSLAAITQRPYMIAYHLDVEPPRWHDQGQNTSLVHKGEMIKLSARWTDNLELANATLVRNETGAWTNVSTVALSGTESWSNFTFAPGADWPVGIIGWKVFANDTSANLNETSVSSFYLWSYANVSASYAEPAIIYNGTATALYCRVIDGYSSLAIENYNVSFFNASGYYLGSNVTNSTGWANITYTDITKAPPSTFNITCNITDQAGLYYNDSATNARNVTLQAVDLYHIPGIAATPVNFGQNVTLIANVSDNATAVTRVWANISYYNLSSIADESEVVNLTLNRAFSALRHEYTVSYNPKRSGRYNVSIKAEAGVRDATNTTNFDVNFGRPVIEFTYPNYRVLNNQSFSIMANITALDGDLWRANFTLTISSQDKLNLTGTEWWTKTDYNLTNGTTLTVNWSAQSAATGYLRMALNVTPRNGTTNQTSIPVSVVLPYLNITPTTINITGNVSLRTSVIGNASAINDVNLTVEKRYTTTVERSQATFTGIDAEETCAGAVTGAGNVALQGSGGSATCTTGVGCNNAIDGSLDTAWLAGSLGDWLLVTFNTTYAIDQLKLYWYNVSNPTNVSIYYERDGTWTPLFIAQAPPTTPGWTTYTELTPFETGRMKINQSTASALALYEVQAHTIARRESKCYVYDYSYTNTTLSGNYTVNTNVSTLNVTKRASSFFANFGRPLIAIDMVSALLEGQNKTYKTTITASGGDLRNVTVNLTIADWDVLNITAGEARPQNISVIFAGQSSTFNWTVNGNMTGITNTTIEVNSTTGEGTYNSTNKTVEVFSSDFVPPVINAFWFEYKGVRTNMTNLRTDYIIFANITDNRAVESAKANITYPNGGGSLNASMTLYSGTDTDGIWNLTFENAGVFLNQTGKYEIRISAQDIKPNETLGAQVNNFTVYGNYSLNTTTSYSSYNRGEGITIKAWDVNDNLVEGLNWSVNITRYNQSEANIFNASNGTNTSFTYQIASDDPRGSCTLFANASKQGNSGNNTWLFNVSALLDVNVSYPAQNTVYALSTKIDNPKAKVYSPRDVEMVDANVSAYCLNQSQTLESSNMSYGITYSGYYSFGFLDVKCYSPNSYSTRFNVTINAVDTYNNTGAFNISLITQAQPPPAAAGGGGGGGVKVKEIINITEIREVTIELALPTYSPSEEQKALLFQGPEFFELVRGRNETFLLRIANPFPDSIIENLTLEVEGYLADYISLAPGGEVASGYKGFTLERAVPSSRRAYLVAYNQSQPFRLQLAAPTYIERGTYPLKFVISGMVAYYDYPAAMSNETRAITARKNVTLEMLETRIVSLVVYEISREDAADALAEAEQSFREVIEAGFPSTRVKKLVEKAREGLEVREYGQVGRLNDEVARIRQDAFTANGLIEEMERRIAEAEAKGLKVIETRELFNLVLAAFEREDFATAQKRIKDAQLVYSVETEGKVNWVKVAFDYWKELCIVMLSASLSGVVGYRRLTVAIIGRRLDSLYVEEGKLNDLMREAQQKFYRERTMSMSVYNKTMHQYENRLSEISQERAGLRARRVGLLRASSEYETLKKEDERLIQLMKDAQNSYFEERSITRSAYRKTMENLKMRKAEVEEGLTMLEAKLVKKRRGKEG